MNGSFTKTVFAAVFTLALPFGTQATPDLSNYKLVDAINGVGYAITGDIDESDSTQGNITIDTVSIGKSSNGSKSQSCYEATSPEEFVGRLAFQSVGYSDKGWWIRMNAEKNVYGLVNGNDRSALILGVDTIDLVKIVCAEDGLTFNSGNYSVETDSVTTDSIIYYVTMNGSDSIAFYTPGNSSLGLTDIYFYQRNSSDSSAETSMYSYTVTAVDGNGNTLEVVASGEADAGDSVTVYYKEYICVDGTLYHIDHNAKSTGLPYWGNVFVIDSDNYSGTLTYSETDITNVVYLIEGEDIEGATKVTSSNSVSRSSQGASGYTDTDITLCSLDEGQYIVNVVVFENNKRNGVYIDTLDIFTVGGDTITFITSTQNYDAMSSDTITLDDTSDFILVGGGTTAKSALDYVYIVSLSGSTDGISEVSAEAESGGATNAPIYSLSGVMIRKAGEGVSGLAKGVYIMNGKKVMIK